MHKERLVNLFPIDLFHVGRSAKCLFLDCTIFLEEEQGEGCKLPCTLKNSRLRGWVKPIFPFVCVCVCVEFYK